MQAEEDATCTDCGQPRDESMRPGNENAYSAPLFTCFGCAALASAREQLSDGDVAMGLHISVVKD